MSCTVSLTGIAYDCETNLSGIKEIFLTDYNDVDGQPTVDNSTGIITSITMESGKTFHSYKPAKNTGSLTKTLTKDEGTGVQYYTNEATAQFNRMDASKRAELAVVDRAQLAAMVLDMNGKYWYLGYDSYATASAVTGQTGAGRDDGNFYTLTITDISGQLPYPVDASAAAAVIDA